MGKGVVFASGIFERYIPEFHFILPIPALFHRQTALVHPVGNVQEAELQFQKRGVVPHIPQVGYQLGYALRHLGNGGHILGHCAQAKSPCPGLQADKAVGNSGKHDGNGTGSGAIQPHGPFGISGKDTSGVKGILLVSIVLFTDTILLIGTHIRSQFPVVPQKAEKAEQAVAQSEEIRMFCPIAFCLISKDGGKQSNPQHQRHHQQHHPGAVQPGIGRSLPRNRKKKKRYRKGNSAQNTHQRRTALHKIIQYPVKAPAACIFVLTDGIQQIRILCLIQIHIIRFQNLLRKEALHLKPGSGILGFLPLFQQGRNQGNPGGGAQGQQHPEDQALGIPLSCQFLNHPGGKIDSRIRCQSSPDSIQGLGKENLGAAAAEI